MHLIVIKQGAQIMNKEEFPKKIIEYENSLYHVAFSIVHNNEDAADAIQNSLIKAYTKLNTLKRDEFFKTWIMRILINECYQFIRSTKGTIQLDDSYKATDISEEIDNNSDIYFALKCLESSYRVPIILFYIEGYSVAEIAASLDISVSTVKIRLHRGRKKLLEIMEK